MEKPKYRFRWNEQNEVVELGINTRRTTDEELDTHLHHFYGQVNRNVYAGFHREMILLRSYRDLEHIHQRGKEKNDIQEIIGKVRSQGVLELVIRDSQKK